MKVRKKIISFPVDPNGNYMVQFARCFLLSREMQWLFVHCEQGSQDFSCYLCTSRLESPSFLCTSWSAFFTARPVGHPFRSGFFQEEVTARLEKKFRDLQTKIFNLRDEFWYPQCKKTTEGVFLLQRLSNGSFRNRLQFESNRLYMCIESTSTCIETTLHRNDREPNTTNVFLYFKMLACRTYNSFQWIMFF